MIITTHDLREPAKVDPGKLNHITTAIIPEAPKVAPPIVGTDLTKMITTNDKPKVGSFDAKKIIDNLVIDLHPKPAETNPVVPAPDAEPEPIRPPDRKGPGRPKKEL